MISLIAALLLTVSAFSAGTCGLVTRSEGVELRRCGNISVLRLEGRPVERAHHMGELLRGPLSRSVVDYFSYKIFDDAAGSPSLVRGLFTLAYNQVVRLLHRAAPTSLSEEIDAFAAGMGVDSIHMKRAISLADTGAALNALNPPSSPVPESGCTSVALGGADHHFFYGRNLDFIGVDLWDKHPLVTVVIPETGSTELKHAVFGADGVLFGGITGMNEAGLTFAVQQNYTRDAGLWGVPMMLIGEIMLREAHSLAEAESILRQNRPAVLWTFIVTDLKTGEAMTVESSQRHFAVRRMGADGLVQTNHVMSPSVLPDERMPLGAKENSIQRMKIAQARLDGMQGVPTLEKMAAVLAYQASAEGEMVAYRDVLKAHTIQTLFFESAGGSPRRVFVSQDNAPTAGGSFVAFDFGELMTGAPASFEIVNPTHPTALVRRRQRETSLAFHAYFDEKDIPKALALLSEHRTLDADLFRATAKYQQGFYQDAVLTVDQALANPRYRGEPIYIFQSLKRVKLASLLQLEKLAEARSLAAGLASEKPANQKLRMLAEQIARGGTPSPRLLRLAFEFFSGDIGERAN